MNPSIGSVSNYPYPILDPPDENIPQALKVCIQPILAWAPIRV
jgi:hypothetical protein